MRKRLFIPRFAVTLLFAVAAAMALQPSSASGQDTKSAPTEVRVDNFSFTPDTLNVPANSTVTWTNKDDIPHGIAATGNAFKRSNAMDTDDTYSFTFTTPGTYQYFCYIHPHMTGTIVVEAATDSNATQ